MSYRLSNNTTPLYITGHSHGVTFFVKTTKPMLVESNDEGNVVRRVELRISSGDWRRLRDLYKQKRYWPRVYQPGIDGDLTFNQWLEWMTEGSWVVPRCGHGHDCCGCAIGYSWARVLRPGRVSLYLHTGYNV